MRRLLSITAVAFFLSMAGKWLADAFLEERVALLGTFLGLQPSRNPGVAFGVTFPYQGVLVGLAVLVVLVLAVRSAKSTLSQWGFGFILDGALGNIADRMRDGLVTDYFQAGSFPIFNVADSCITVGVILLLVEALLPRKE